MVTTVVHSVVYAWLVGDAVKSVMLLLDIRKPPRSSASLLSPLILIIINNVLIKVNVKDIAGAPYEIK